MAFLNDQASLRIRYEMRSVADLPYTPNQVLLIRLQRNE